MRRKVSRRRTFAAILALSASVALGFGNGPCLAERNLNPWYGPPAETRDNAPRDKIAAAIVAGAHEQEGDLYHASYVRISYPDGDVPAGEGACTDVVVRSLRAAGYDLQRLIHEDMVRHFRRYPAAWKLGHPDTNIDHRKVPNQMVFFAAYGATLPLGITGTDLATWLPGDIVCWKPGGRQWHIGIISDHVTMRGRPLVIHNGWICTEEDCLTKWPIIGHYRFPMRTKGHPYPAPTYRVPARKAAGSSVATPGAAV